MQDLFQLSAPWWHFVLRACAIYVLVMVLVRVSGKRAVGQFTPFDLVLLMATRCRTASMAVTTR